MTSRAVSGALVALSLVVGLGAACSSGGDEAPEAADDSVPSSEAAGGTDVESEEQPPPPEIVQAEVLEGAWLDLSIGGGRCTMEIVANGGRLRTTALLDADGGIDASVEGFAGRGPGGTDELRVVRGAFDPPLYYEVDGRWVEVDGDDADFGLIFLVDPLLMLSGTSVEELDAGTPAADLPGGTTYAADQAMLPPSFTPNAVASISLTTDPEGHLVRFEADYEADSGPGHVEIECSEHGTSTSVESPEDSISAEEAFGA